MIMSENEDVSVGANTQSWYILCGNQAGGFSAEVCLGSFGDYGYNCRVWPLLLVFLEDCAEMIISVKYPQMLQTPLTSQKTVNNCKTYCSKGCDVWHWKIQRAI